MSCLTRLKIVQILELQYLNSRRYTRWSHRRPKRVLTAEEYTNIESQHEEDYTKSNNVQFKSTFKKNTNINQFKNVDELEQSVSKIHWTTNDKRVGKWDKSKINTSDFDDKSKVSLVTNIPNKQSRNGREPIFKTIKDVESQPKDMLETIIDADGNFIYMKLPEKDPSLSKVLVTAKSRNEQVKKDLTLLEGKRLIKEALEANCKLRNIIFSRKSDLEYIKPFLPKSGAKLYKVPYREIQMWSDLSTSPGIMGIFKIPEVEKYVPSKDSLELIVVCDNIREPGNLGAILRTAVGVGVQSVILTKGCVDLWEPKVLRSACGAHFQLQIHRKMSWTDIKSHLQNLKGSVLIADNKITSDGVTNETCENLEDTVSKLPFLPYYSVNFEELGAIILIIGGETEGISGDAYRFAAEYSGLRLHIPLSNNIDSLNTGISLGIILFEIKKQLVRLKYNAVHKIQNC